MTWNYRAVRRVHRTAEEDVEEYYVAEVHYDEAGEIWGWSAKIAPGGETLEELKQDLELMLKDVQRRPVLEHADLPNDSGEKS